MNELGTFWIDYTKFMMGFSHVDVCYAFRGWRTSSSPQPLLDGQCGSSTNHRL